MFSPSVHLPGGILQLEPASTTLCWQLCGPHGQPLSSVFWLLGSLRGGWWPVPGSWLQMDFLAVCALKRNRGKLTSCLKSRPTISSFTFCRIQGPWSTELNETHPSPDSQVDWLSPSDQNLACTLPSGIP